jgi:methyltransferase OMS1
MALSRAPVVTEDVVIPDDVSDRYNRTAATFDADINLTEKLMRLGRLRKSLVKQSSGHVLEVGVGTGRNFRYYDLGHCKSLTFVDKSPEMVAIAKTKFKGRRWA